MVKCQVKFQAATPLAKRNPTYAREQTHAAKAWMVGARGGSRLRTA
jgi:hypothetical protein